MKLLMISLLMLIPAITTAKIQLLNTSLIALSYNFNLLQENIEETFISWITSKKNSAILSYYPEMNLYHLQGLKQGPTGCNVHAFRNGLYLLAMAHKKTGTILDALYNDMIDQKKYDNFFDSIGCTKNKETYFSFVAAKNFISTNTLSCLSSGCVPENSVSLLDFLVKFNPYTTTQNETKASMLNLDDLVKKEKLYAKYIKDIEKIPDLIAQEYATYASHFPHPDYVDPLLQKNMYTYTHQNSASFALVLYPFTVMPHAATLLFVKENNLTTHVFMDSLVGNYTFSSTAPSSWEKRWYNTEIMHIKQLLALSADYDFFADTLVRVVCLNALYEIKNNPHVSKETFIKNMELFAQKNSLKDRDLYKLYFNHISS